MDMFKEAGKPRLSAIMPLRGPLVDFNFLKELLVQSENKGIQVIVVHDINDVATSSILRELFIEFKLSMHQLFEARLNSPGLARNVGLLNSSADWVCFWDSDDQPIPEQFLRMIQFGVERKSEIVIGEFSNLESGAEKKIKSKELRMREISIVLNPGIWRMIFRRELLEPTRFIRSLMGEDQAFLVDIQLFKRKIDWYPHVTYKYRVGEVNQLTSNSKNVRELESTIRHLVVDSKVFSSGSDKYGILVTYKMLATGILRGSLGLRIKFTSLAIVGIPILICRLMSRGLNK